MMTHAYSELYLNDARRSLSSMFDYAVNDCKYDIDIFADMFVKSGYARLFETGNTSVIAGMSGIELADRIIECVYDEEIHYNATQPLDRSPEFWAGWAIAYYQWFSRNRFRDIFEKVKMSGVVDMYPVYHEMDITHFCETMDNELVKMNREIRLKKIREAAGLSQSELAKRSGVNLRSVQMYEQQKNDIDKAQGQILYKLAATLGCDIEDLLERPNT